MLRTFAEVLDICNGRNQKKVENPNGNYPIYGSGGIMGYADEFICPNNTVLIGRKGSINNPIFVDTPLWNVDTAFGLVAKQGALLPKYLYYFCVHFDFEKLNTTVTIPSLTKANLLKIQMPVPDVSEQQTIVSTLDKLQSIITHRKQQLLKLDELVKARFVEMFGDPEADTCTYETKKLKELSIKISDGVHAKPAYTESGRPFLSVVNINRKKVDFTDCKYVSEEAYQKMIKSTHPEKGDVLYTKVGATYGIPAYVDTDIEFCLYVSVCLIKPKHELINSKFLAIQMDMPFVKHQADRRIKGIGVPDLHLNQISEFDIICPPRELQDSFVAFVEQTNKSKFDVGAYRLPIPNKQ
ncbi:MAG: restriction endonuclease subunit S [Oscillospiraceae bacterium]|nr:restriction endonuclease subunit S [Oscillospiraceae bacterium]